MFLDSLPPEEHQALRPHLQRVQLVPEQMLHWPNERPEHVYFPINAGISLVMAQSGTEIEVGLIGNEGMLGLSTLLPMPPPPIMAIVQFAGDSWCMRAADFHAAVLPGRELYALLLRYSYLRAVEMAQQLVCSHAHELAQRCSRWLLTAQDRLGRGQIRVTHEMLGRMLAIRRPAVTEAMGTLQTQGAITYQRGDVTIVDRQRLVRLACPCYAIVGRYVEQLHRPLLPQPGILTPKLG